MTDTERERINAICEVANVKDIDDLSDGFHTFRQLYYQRMMLFATIVRQNREKAWKSLRHEDGELCFGGGWFIVGIDTPEGSYTYHYEDSFYSLFDCEELECAKHWDGHTEKDVTRLLSLPSAQPEQAVKDCRNCQHGKYNDHLEIHFCYNPNECTEWKLWEPIAQLDFDTTEKIDKAHDDGYKQGYLQGKSDYERKTGEWIPTQNPQWKAYYHDKCSACGWWNTKNAVCRDSEKKAHSLNFCPNCGAMMKGGE